MANFELSDKEREILADALEYNLTTLHDEIAHTDTMEYKKRLEERREVLNKIRDRLH